MAESIKIDVATFHRHLSKLYDSWRADRQKEWQSADAIAIVHGTSSDDTIYHKAAVLHSWLIGYELSDTLMLFTESTLILFTSPKKALLLKSLVREEGQPAVRIMERSRDEPINAETIRQLIGIARASFSGAKLGVLAKERNHGTFVKTCDPMLKEPGFEVVDITTPLASLWRIKDASEVQSLKEAAGVSMRVLKRRAVTDMERALDEGSKSRVTNAVLAEKAAAAFEDPAILKAALSEVVDPCYPPIVQSGGKYDFGWSAESTRDPLHAGTITIALGARFRCMCSNIARTYMINATKEQEEIYRVALDAQRRLIEELRPGVRIQQAVQQARSTIENGMPSLVPLLPKNFGHGMGMEFKEFGMLLTERNEVTIHPGMSFNVSVAIPNIPLKETSKDSKKNTFAVQIADTVLVTENGPEVLTNDCSKQWSDITYSLDDDEPKPERKFEKIDEDIDIPVDIDINQPRSTRQRELRDNKPKATADAERRRQHQVELAKTLHEGAQQRLLNRGEKASSASRRDDELANAIAYENVDQMPRMEPGRIFVDMDRSAVVLPICGLMVPFHARVIKNVTSRDDMLRINFVTPQAVGGGAATRDAGMEKRMFVKELTYRIPNPNKHEPNKHLETTERLIKELRKRLTAQTTESKQREEEEMVPQEALRIQGGRVPKLTDVFVEPNLAGGKRTSGQLEAHSNGFRFRSYKGATLDIMYKNIKHAFFQPGEQELIVLIHFHLKSPIVVNKKKVKDVQFYTEVTEVVCKLYERSRYGEQDEFEEEQQERERRRKHNLAYQTFVNQVSELEGFAGHEFDIPYRELGFHGVPFKSNVFLQPTVHCLVNLTESPYFVLTLDDVELVHFERVSETYKLRNFDMVFIFKDYTKPVVRVNVIPIDSLEPIKEWLDSINIKFSEGPGNLNWNHIMQTIVADMQGFFDGGGWSFLDPDSSEDEDEDDDEQEGSDFHPDSSDEGESSDSDFSDASEGSASESDGDGGDEDDDDIVGGSDDDEDDEDEAPQAKKSKH
eukprot:m51a1_g5700 putative fact complex subunit spt16 (1015) ;mRNA; f:1028518-1032300